MIRMLFLNFAGISALGVWNERLGFGIDNEGKVVLVAQASQ